ncbi:hypothetical protein PSACC_00298 [Paramicrosporidium saccamoebae]|uniref:Uncharacterized protein n=1 Tax=Paramicrosporidium saccamoebae TaxID=1246581 RepID=A0A2H9TQF2_9FUNG|nr:hypothetical protein PSACC_00298 [Paramicrosporidium saccamoebae]
MDQKGWLRVSFSYLLAACLPPIAAIITHGLSRQLIIACVLTFVLPLAYLTYLCYWSMFQGVHVLYCYLLIFPGSIFAIWLTFKSIHGSSDTSLDNIVAEPKPQRLASHYQTQLEIQVTPSGSTGYSGKYSPMTMSPSESDVK